MQIFKSKKDIWYLAILISFGLIVIIVGGMIIYSLDKENKINSFDDCAKYYPVLESFPERCITKDGRSFVKPISAQDFETTGTLVCLPHRDKKGPQTLECAQGLLSKDGNWYGLDFSRITLAAGSIQTNKEYKVSGKFTPNTDPNEKYDIVGTIELSNITKLPN